MRALVSSSHRAGEAGEFVATLPELLRLNTDLPLNWLREAAATREWRSAL